MWIASAWVGAIALATPVVESPPNIVVILADDLGYGDVGCYSEASKVPTPHLDRLAAQGMRFLDAHSPSTVCTPTRYSLLTGRMAFRTGMRSVFTGVGGPCLIEEGRLTLPQLLRDRGYRTQCVGKWHVGLTCLDSAGMPIDENGLEAVKRIDFARGVRGGPTDRGFDGFFGTASCPTTDWLYAYIDGNQFPVPPVDVLDRSTLPKHPYSRDNRPGLVALDFDLEQVDMLFLEKSLQFLADHATSRRDRPFFLFHSMQAVHLPSFPAPEFHGKTDAGPHGDFLHEMDHIVGALMSALEEHGFADNTLVWFTSDNGPETLTTVQMRQDHQHDPAHPWRGMKRDQWEGGHRVPLLVRWPGHIEAGRITDQTVCLTDLMATCAAIVDASLPNDAAEDSVDLSPILLGPRRDEPLRDYTLHQTNSLALAIRQGPWKYLDHPGSGGNRYDRGRLQPYALPDTVPHATAQLYHLVEDPGETTNLIEEYPDVARALKKTLDEACASGRSVPER